MKQNHTTMKMIIVAACTLMMASCNMNPCGLSKAHFLKNYESFVDEVADLDLKYKSKAWDRYDEKFKEYTDECYPTFEDDLNRKEQRKFESNTARFLVTRYGISLFRDLESNEEFKEKFEEIVEEIGEYAEQYGEAISDAVEEFVNEIDREAWDDAINQVGDFFRNLDLNLEINTDDKN